MWQCPERSVFDVEDHGVLRGIGKLNWSFLSTLKTFSATAITRAKRDIFKDSSLANQLVLTLEDLLHRLEYISTNFRTMQLGVRSTQRVFLELTACLDYLELYKPVVDGVSPPESIPKVAHMIGAFTTDLTICFRMHLAKIPVWLIRPYKALHSIRIAAVVPVQFPEGIVALGPATRPSYPAIFRGPHGLDRYRAFIQHVLRYFKYPDPFGSVRAQPSVSLPAPPPELSKREIRARRFTPCMFLPIIGILPKIADWFHFLLDAKRKTNPAALSAGRSKFEDPESPFLPPAIPMWRKALENVNVDEAQFAYADVTPTDLGYVFPEPALFMSIQSPDRQKAYFYSWLKFRSALVYRVTSSGSNARPMPNTVWRTLLSLEYLTKENVAKSGTRSEKLRETVTEFLQNCLEEEGVELSNISANVEVTWNGRRFESLGKDEFEEILWELAELNFRFELLALDSRASTTNVNRQNLVAACFPRPSMGASLIVPDLSVANHGLASFDTEERKAFLQALRKVMSSWRGEMPAIIGIESFRWHLDVLEDLEQAVTAHYCKTFYNYFRRAPIIPRRLSHIASPYTPPTPPIIVLDPMPNIFYDTTVLAPL